MSQTPSLRPCLAHHGHRRTLSPRRGGLRRTLGGDYEILRGRLDPTRQLFGQVTSGTRHRPAYDHTRSGSLTKHRGTPE